MIPADGADPECVCGFRLCVAQQQSPRDAAGPAAGAFQHSRNFLEYSMSEDDPLDSFRCDVCKRLADLTPIAPNLYLCDYCAGEQQEQLASLRRYLAGYRSFDWPELEDGLSAEEQIDQLMESASEQEIYCGWCLGNRNFYDADDMEECQECDKLFSRDHLRGTVNDWKLCSACGSECTQCRRFEHPGDMYDGLCNECVPSSDDEPAGKSTPS